MRRSFLGLVVLCLGIVLSLVLASPVSAKEKAAKAPKEGRISGTIHMINKDTSTITVSKGNVQRQVVYSAETKITKRNAPGSMDDVKEGRRVICLGKFDEKARLVATRIDVRSE